MNTFRVASEIARRVARPWKQVTMKQDLLHGGPFAMQRRTKYAGSRCIALFSFWKGVELISQISCEYKGKDRDDDVYN